MIQRMCELLFSVMDSCLTNGEVPAQLGSRTIPDTSYRSKQSCIPPGPLSQPSEGLRGPVRGFEDPCMALVQPF